MSKIRLFILIFGPFPIVWASMAFCDYFRSEVSGPVHANHVLANIASASDNVATNKPAKSQRLEAACRRTADRLQPRLGPSCQVLVRAPFVIAGNLTEDELDDWHRKTIGPAVEALSSQYFRTPPSEPITILLFADEASYNQYAEKLFDDRGVSIYGYYKPQVRTLVMNISTGGGTLVHELTHALVDFDFPQIPDWFNEGLASLYEQCQFRQNATGPGIEGLPNWRLPGLQKAIRTDRLRSLESLISADDFRGEQEGLNYAQARYLCLMMQCDGVLEKFYRRFRATQKTDPSGSKALLEAFSNPTWAELDQKYQQFVLSLRRS